MKRNLYIKNFIVLKEIEYRPRRFNVIIGAQSSGKSLLVKLDYFFQEIFSSVMIQSIFEQERKNEFIQRIKREFYRYFEQRIWQNFPFEIVYNLDDFVIKIYKDKKALKIETDKRIDAFRREEIRKYKRFKDDPFGRLEYIDDLKKRAKRYFLDLIFIPAARSYFANIDRSIYSILEKNYSIDPFLILFGLRYENAKEIVENRQDRVDSFIQERIELILQGDISYSKEFDNIGIKREDIFMDIYHLSSGQQESLPLLLLASILSGKGTIFVEEPEAHLFPKSQKAMVEIIAYLYKNNFDITLTTHSPYILTSLNILLLAKDVEPYLPEKLLYLSKVAVALEDLRAYAIEDGRLVDIVNAKNRLIEGYTIDKISEEFGEIFDILLEYEGKR